MPKLLRLLTSRSVPAALAVTLVALFVPQSANAYHDGLHLEVTPEVGSFTLGEPAVLTAVLVGDGQFPTPAPNDTRIDFENENGANDGDGNSILSSPDYSCVIPVEATSCQIEIEATRTGTALFRAWFGTADAHESRFAGLEDCRQQSDTSSNCVANDTNGAPNAGSACGINSSTSTQLPGEEPDCTDVVQVVFLENAPGTLDCDDSTGPDTERELNPSSSQQSAMNPSTETYTCYVRDELGNLKPGVQVLGEIIEGVNDPDGRASFTSADFTCDATRDGTTTTRNDDPTTPGVNEKGSCPVSVTQKNNQIGKATICFWVGQLSEGADLCTSEEVGAGTNHEGADAQGDNRVDLVELVWENISDLVLDCSPESGFSLVNSIGKVECTALSTISQGPVQGIDIRAEAVGANDPDDSDSPQTPDFHEDENPASAACTTAANGRCFIEHQGTDAGETTYRAWIDDGNDSETTGSGTTTQLATDYDPTEGRDEKQVPGTTGEPDATDVVMSVWGQGPTSITASPKTGQASIGDCHEITLTATDREGNAVGGIRIDVEQQHEHFRNATPNDEPIVGFCTPLAGPNPSDVDTAAGDLQPSGGGPNTSGNAGGETVGFTDVDGLITIGVMTQGARGSSGAGTVYVTTWWETIDNDDPSGGEPSDSSLVTWSPGANAAILELTPDVNSADVGDETTYTATVTQNGEPVAGVEVSWSLDGRGAFTWNEPVTDSAGQAIATVSSESKGSTAITATCGGTFTCSDTSTQNWGPVFCDVVGTEGTDVLTGSDAPETICGFGGNDIIDGGGGDDVILGGAGDDQLLGGEGDDELMGAGGKDLLTGGLGNDQLIGGNGADRLRGDAGKDILFGGAGNDRLKGGTESDKLVGGSGRDALDGGAGRDECYRDAAKPGLMYRC